MSYNVLKIIFLLIKMPPEPGFKRGKSCGQIKNANLVMDTTDELTSCWFAQSSLTVF
jgi:hypothetical protein